MSNTLNKLQAEVVEQTANSENLSQKMAGKFKFDNFLSASRKLGAILLVPVFVAGGLAATSNEAHADSTTNRAALVGVGTAAVAGVMTGDWKAALGALGGAAAGSVVGQGNGKVAATALGAIAGGYATHRITEQRELEQQQMYYQQRQQYPQSNCVPGYPTSDCSNNGYQQQGYNNYPQPQQYGNRMPQGEPLYAVNTNQGTLLYREYDSPAFQVFYGNRPDGTQVMDPMAKRSIEKSCNNVKKSFSVLQTHISNFDKLISIESSAERLNRYAADDNEYQVNRKSAAKLEQKRSWEIAKAKGKVDAAYKDYAEARGFCFNNLDEAVSTDNYSIKEYSWVLDFAKLTNSKSVSYDVVDKNKVPLLDSDSKRHRM